MHVFLVLEIDIQIPRHIFIIWCMRRRFSAVLVQSHRFCHGRFSSLCACASHHRFQKYGGLHEERTLAESFRKGENEDKNDCHKTTRDTEKR